MTDTIPGWDDMEEIDPSQVPDDVLIPGSRPRVDHNKRREVDSTLADVLPE